MGKYDQNDDTDDEYNDNDDENQRLALYEVDSCRLACSLKPV